MGNNTMPRGIKEMIEKTAREAAKSVGLGEAGQKAQIAEIVYHEGKLQIPHGMAISDAINLLEDRREYLEKEVNIVETFDAFPWDGANAINAVLAAKYGWAQSVATPGFFGPTPPALINIEVAPGVFKDVPWGSFSLPQVDGRLETSANMKSGRLAFQLVASVKRKDEATVRNVFDLVRAHLREHSIYRGQAIKIRFRSDDGSKLKMPEPVFMDTSSISEDMVIYSEEVQEQIRINLFTPITRVSDCLANGMSIKRGVLLGGTYGTGKTLAAMVAAALAVRNGITFVYTSRTDELSDAIEFAKQYQAPASVVFVEDIDREMDGERTEAMDDILNIIDGIDTKTANIICVLTTNALENINSAMLRPGRLDAVIEVTPPDAKAVERLIRLYGKDAVEKDTDLTGVGEALAGRIPAVIAEVVKRAKMAQLYTQPKGTFVKQLTAEALLAAALSMKSQLDLLEASIARDNAVEKPELSAALEDVLENVVNSKIDRFAERLGYGSVD